MSPRPNRRLAPAPPTPVYARARLLQFNVPSMPLAEGWRETITRSSFGDPQLAGLPVLAEHDWSRQIGRVLASEERDGWLEVELSLNSGAWRSCSGTSFGLIADPDADEWGEHLGCPTVLRRNSLVTHVSLVGWGAHRGTVLESGYDREREYELLSLRHRRSLRRAARDRTRLYRLGAARA